MHVVSQFSIGFDVLVLLLLRQEKTVADARALAATATAAATAAEAATAAAEARAANAEAALWESRRALRRLQRQICAWCRLRLM